MNKDDIAEVMAKPIAQHLLLDSPIPARLAYVAVDGDPRVVPVGSSPVSSTPTQRLKIGP